MKIRIPEASKRAQVSESLVRRWVRDGLVSATRAGGKIILVDAESLDAFLSEAPRTDGSGDYTGNPGGAALLVDTKFRG